jgi:Uma2 family endonuclease
MTYAEYLAAEAAAEVRHEFLNGDVWAMAGGTPEHAALAAALIRELGAALRAKPCRVYTSDLRVRILETGLSTYPDVSVVCGSAETAPDDPEAITNPSVVAEVLSDTSEGYDRGARAAHYRRLSSLQEYVLVGQTEPLIEVYRRTEAGRWELLEGRPGERVELRSLGISLDVAAVYANPLTPPG